MSNETLYREVNGVNLEHLGQAVQSIQENPRAGDYRFYTETRWESGAVSQTQVKRWISGEEGQPARQYTAHEIWIDEPAGLLGTDTSANPVETILAGLAGCLAIGVSYNAAARGIELEELRISLEGSLNLQGFLGLDREVRPGYDNILLDFHIKSPAAPEAIHDLIRYVRETSPVLDIISNPVPVQVGVQLH